VCLWDRPPGAGAVILGQASLNQLERPSLTLGNLGEMATRHMPAVTVYGVEVVESCLDEDYQAMELL